jgi:formylglycine-generating enzyme required for sulfatase activity
MPDVFISYSRSNLEFIRQLADSLTERGRSPWFDQIKEPLQGIPPGSKWWDEITYGIENADNFLFIISPQSIASPYCHAELSHALKHDKRIVTLLYCDSKREIDTLQALDDAIDAIPDDTLLPDSVMMETTHLRTLVRGNWLALSQIQYVVFSEQVHPETSLDQLIQALDLDLAWVKMRSQIRQAAQLWEANSRSKGYLWSQERLKPVYEMMSRVQPQLSPLEQDFLKPELEHLLDELKEDQITHIRREAIGQRLFEIGDTRRGVGLRPDGFPDIDWCYVEGGRIEINLTSQVPYMDAEPANVRVFEFAPFFISRYLVTHTQFQAFLDAPNGFKDDRWWSMLDADERKRIMSPQKQKYGNYPRDTVTWAQSVAFTQWLTTLMPADGLPEGARSGWTIRLPYEWEWQWAAQGETAVRTYPWGEEEESFRANTSESALGRSTAVGLYPHGMAACGALDMAGSLGEWCLNTYAAVPSFDQSTKLLRVIHGGSFQYGLISARCADRHNAAIGAWNNHEPLVGTGFRVVYAPDSNLSDGLILHRR